MKRFLWMLLLALPTAAAAADLDDLFLYYGEDDLVVTALRSPRRASSVAENITVVTAEEIAEMNAHTLLDVLRNVPGVQVDVRGGPGIFSGVLIQGADFRQVRVVLDGVPLNSMIESAADLAVIPVQVVERLEIIKGPASSSWGSGHGGVINVVTKSGTPGEAAAGSLLVSGGERGTVDLRGDVSVSAGPTGWYLSGNALASEGFQANNRVRNNSSYAKSSWASGALRGSVSAGRFTADTGEGAIPEFAASFSSQRSVSVAAMNLEYRVSDDLQWTANLRNRRLEVFSFRTFGDVELNASSKELLFGGSVVLNWRRGYHLFTAGLDLDYSRLDADLQVPLEVLPSLTRWGVFLSDSVELGSITLTPSVRYDFSSDQQGNASASLGATWSVGGETLLRAYFGSGYTLPLALRDARSTKAVSAQVGVESADLPGIRLKASLFRNDISNALRTEEDRVVFNGQETRTGGELELATEPVWNTSLTAGFTLVHIDQTAQPERTMHTWDLGIRYRGGDNTASLLGHYIWWNDPAPEPLRGKYNGFVWDINLGRTLYREGDRRAEVFFAGHNLLNASQYVLGVFRNPPRWVELGVRLEF